MRTSAEGARVAHELHLDGTRPRRADVVPRPFRVAAQVDDCRSEHSVKGEPTRRIRSLTNVNLLLLDVAQDLLQCPP